MARAASPAKAGADGLTARQALRQQQHSQAAQQVQQQHPSKQAPGQQHHQQHQGSEPLSPLLQVLAGLVSTVLWCLCSSTLIVLNNALYKGGFPFPMMVTGLGQLFSVAAGLLLAAAGAMPLRRPPASAREWGRLAPIVACTAGTMFLGNAPYMHLSLSFIQILKAFTPALTLLVGAAAGVERMSGALVASVLLIAAGTGGAVLAESGAPSYSVYGLVLFMGSSLTEAGRVVCSQLLLGPHRYNSADVLVYVGLPSSLTLIGGSLLFERRAGLLPAAAALLPRRAGAFVQAGVMSGLVNLTSYLAIATTSSLTFKVSGCLKNLGVVWHGVAAHGDTVTARHLLGYAVSMAGFVVYSYTRNEERRRSSASGSGGGAAAKKRA